MRIEILDEAGKVRAQAEGVGDARLVYAEAYMPGDAIRFTSDDMHVVLSVDASVEPALVFVPDRQLVFRIPFGDATNGYAPQAFKGSKHALWIRPATTDQLLTYRNIAQNPVDQRQDAGCFPHASANVETRDEAQFWARNVIDGHRFNDYHGGWPYHSWGIGQREDACLHVDFGRDVEIDAVALVLRADFPHDAWWERATITCSDGFVKPLTLVKTVKAQRFSIGQRVVRWVELHDLVKADDPSPYPALTQFEVYGRDIR